MTDLENFYIKSFKGQTDFELFHSVVCIFALLEQSTAEYLGRFNLSPVKFNTLMLIKHKNDAAGLSQNEISRHLIVSPSNITRLLDRLKIEGLITRNAVKGDRRVNMIKITAKGSDLLDKVWVGYCDVIKSKANLLDKKSQGQLAQLLLNWFGQLEKEGKNG